MQVFVANTTQQYHDFGYRVPENNKLIIQRIAPGGQVRLSANRGDLSRQDIDSIVAQHQKYGLIEESEVGKAASRGMLCALVIGVDRPVNIDRVIAQVRLNRNVLIAQGKEAREAAAVALNQQIEANIQMAGGTDVLREVEVTLEETKRSQSLDRRTRDEGLDRELAEAAPVGEGIRVRRQEPGEAPPRGRGRQRQTLSRGT